MREGPLLKGLATCGHCGRRLSTHATGHPASPGCHCAGARRGVYCLSVDAVEIDAAVARAVLDALAPAGLEAALSAAERPAADHDRTIALWHHAVERTSYRAERAKSRYMAVDPDNRLVASGLEAEWEQSLRALEKAKADLARRERPRTLSAEDRRRLLSLGAALQTEWQAPTTSPRDQKELLSTLVEEIIVTVHKAEPCAKRSRAVLSLNSSTGVQSCMPLHASVRAAPPRLTCGFTGKPIHALPPFSCTVQS
jgi:hypothetical protein